MSETPGTTLEVLKAMVARPGLYWFRSDNDFHSLCAYLDGYRAGKFGRDAEDDRRPLDDAVPDDFHQFVTEFYGHSYPYGGWGWMSLIQAHSESPREAMELFLELRALYDERTKGEQCVAPNSPLARVKS